MSRFVIKNLKEIEDSTGGRAPGGRGALRPKAPRF